MTTTQRPVSVDELKRAWQALHAGAFAQGTTRTRRSLSQTWQPVLGERVIAVAGCAGHVGASTVALAIAESAQHPSRVIECSSAPASGLAAASTAELGLCQDWRQGRRQSVLIERASKVLTGPIDVPPPTAHVGLTVVDLGWDLGQVLTSQGWLADMLATIDDLVIVTVATVPGMRRAESALTLLRESHHQLAAHVAVVGPRHRKWHDRSAPRVGRSPGLSSASAG